MGYRITYNGRKQNHRAIVFAVVSVLFLGAVILSQRKLNWVAAESISAFLREADSLRKAAEIFYRDIVLNAKDIY